MRCFVTPCAALDAGTLTVKKFFNGNKYITTKYKYKYLGSKYFTCKYKYKYIKNVLKYKYKYQVPHLWLLEQSLPLIIIIIIIIIK